MFDDNPLTTEGAVSQNRDSVQVYFPRAFSAQLHFPLSAEDDYAAHIVPGQALVLYPADDLPEWPLQVAHPNRIMNRLQTAATDGAGGDHR